MIRIFAVHIQTWLFFLSLLQIFCCRLILSFTHGMLRKIFSRGHFDLKNKQGLKFHANWRQFARNVKPYFLRKNK